MKKSDITGLIALSPLFVFIGLYLITSLIVQDFYKVPITVAFLIASIYGVAIMRGVPIEQRITLFSKGAGSPNMMLMFWIFCIGKCVCLHSKIHGGN
jgi:Na+/H+ antiporter NhaC